MVITGGRPRGTLYGAYEFLERCVGVRFLDAATEYVPQRPTLTLPADMAIQSKPAFFRREVFLVTPHQPKQILFQVRRKINAFGNAAVAAAGPELGFCTLLGSPYSTHTHHLYTRDFPTDKPEYLHSPNRATVPVRGRTDRCPCRTPTCESYLRPGWPVRLRRP